MKSSITGVNCEEMPELVKKVEKEEQPMLDEEEETIWDSMHVVQENKKRKKLVPENAHGKVKKKLTDVSEFLIYFLCVWLMVLGHFWYFFQVSINCLFPFFQFQILA